VWVALGSIRYREHGHLVGQGASVGSIRRAVVCVCAMGLFFISVDS
jgi:hypothetical protein